MIAMANKVTPAIRKIKTAIENSLILKQAQLMREVARVEHDRDYFAKSSYGYARINLYIAIKRGQISFIDALLSD